MPLFTLNAGKADKIADLHDWGVVYITVIGGAALRVGVSDNALMQNVNEGVPSVAATPNLVYWWIGPMFAIPDANCTISVNVPTLLHGKTLGGPTVRRGGVA